ncbi:MAG: tRNA (guanosine(37)-N1)-methyltransferase TrmD [Terriglobia bacterium]|nr:tRNA (guanosine(37)-N1)-methyltransferase TrmD [Terriglobia bacterium]
MQFDIITVFPQFFDGPFGFGVLGRALDDGRVRIGIHNLRDFTTDRHKTVDDRPFGGGEGMVLKPEPLFRAVESLGIAEKNMRNPARERVVLLSAQGKPFTQAVARELSQVERIVFLCGRYEGVDERVNDLLADTELSIGDYVISGGELAAAVIVDAVSRLLPGVLGNEDSARYESFAAERPAMPQTPTVPAGETGVEKLPPKSTWDSGGLLDYPHYTRPPEFRGAEVPAVLSSGNHEDIRRWRRRQSLAKTLRNRPELLTRTSLSEEDRALLEEMRHER